MSLITTGVTSTIPLLFNEAQTTKETYRIYLEKGQDGWWVVTSTDLKGLVTQGDTEAKAIKNAYEAAELLVEEYGLKKDFNLVVIDRD
jgi:predicted RNase H-like HicB family nuclease